MPNDQDTEITTAYKLEHSRTCTLRTTLINSELVLERVAWYDSRLDQAMNPVSSAEIQYPR